MIHFCSISLTNFVLPIFVPLFFLSVCLHTFSQSFLLFLSDVLYQSSSFVLHPLHLCFLPSFVPSFLFSSFFLRLLPSLFRYFFFLAPGSIPSLPNAFFLSAFLIHPSFRFKFFPPIHPSFLPSSFHPYLFSCFPFPTLPLPSDFPSFIPSVLSFLPWLPSFLPSFLPFFLSFLITSSFLYSFLSSSTMFITRFGVLKVAPYTHLRFLLPSLFLLPSVLPSLLPYALFLYPSFQNKFLPFPNAFFLSVFFHPSSFLNSSLFCLLSFQLSSPTS